MYIIFFSRKLKLIILFIKILLILLFFCFIIPKIFEIILNIILLHEYIPRGNSIRV